MSSIEQHVERGGSLLGDTDGELVVIDGVSTSAGGGGAVPELLSVETNIRQASRCVPNKRGEQVTATW